MMKKFRSIDEHGRRHTDYSEPDRKAFLAGDPRRRKMTMSELQMLYKENRENERERYGF
jgi:hypothetical protein